MKTADLIPFILLELTDGVKYGFELIKSIETKSNGKIVVKQPTLYTVLKKLEKSKFISSYWEDSEIGGKRHYYKLTENGKLQVSTLPSYDILMNNLLKELSENGEIELQANTIQDNSSNISIIEQIKEEPKETVLATEEVFHDNGLDNQTEYNINLNNTNILKDENYNSQENFAENTDVTTFTEKLTTPTPEIPNINIKENSINILELPDFKINNTNEPIKFVDYKDFKKDENYKYAKKTAKFLVFKSFLSSIYIAFILALCGIITTFSGKSALYYSFLIVSVLFALFYPIVMSLNYEKLRIKYQTEPYKNSVKKQLVVALCIILAVALISIFINLALSSVSLINVLAFNNFENFYAPLLYSSTLLFDIFIGSILFKNSEK